MANNRDNVLVRDLILVCTSEVSSETAQKAIRALCRFYGGQMIYIPVKKETGTSAENLRGVLADAVGGCDAEKILGKIMMLYGNMQLYIPLERTAFRKTIALEIYERYGNDGSNMNDLARNYGISFTLAYNLWKLGRHEKLNSSLPYLPFLEVATNNNSG
jgi:Mor family transcriptional regulator